MRLSNLSEHFFRVGVCSVLLAFVAGCTGLKKPDRSSAEVKQLRELNARYAESLTDSLTQSLVESKRTVHELRRKMDKLRDESKTEVSVAESLRNELADAQEISAKLVAERVAAVTKLERSEKSRQTLVTNLKQVQEQAAKNVEEFADLRQKVAEYEERTGGLRASATSLRKEFSRVNRELERTRSELVTRDAVIQSMTTGSDSEKLLSRKLASVEAEKQDLLAHYEELAVRLKSQGYQVPDVVLGSSSEEVNAPTKPALAGSESFGDFATLVKMRSASIFGGSASWDGIDVTLVVAFAGILLFLVWLIFLPVRAGRSRRLHDEISLLEQKVFELANPERVEERSQELSPPLSDRILSPSGSFVRRRDQFSPILSTQLLAEEGAVAGDYGEEPQDFEYDTDERDVDEVTVNLGQAAEGISRPSDILMEHEEQVASVQDEVLGASAWDVLEGEDIELVKTQIIPGLDDVDNETETPSTASRGTGEKTDDREFMAELKDLIGQKVNDMIR